MDKLQFKISSALKDLVGKDLIRNDNIAVFELVKNSYDAFATKVEITFEKNRIVIADNGKGMTFDDLENKWLFLAYSAKKDRTEDSEEEKQQSYRDNINRHYAGAKGVGRFSCDRLGENLVLTTKSLKDEKTQKLIIDWKEFEKDQKQEFVNIEIPHEIISDSVFFPEEKETGTILEITNLRENWDRKKILDLKQSLEKLINPFSESLDFSIEVICEHEKVDDEKAKLEKKYDKDIVNGIIKNSISQVISIKTTRIDVTLDEQYIETSITDRDTEIYRIREKNIFNKLSSVSINLYFLNKTAKTSFSIRMGVPLVQYGSIFLFRNGFRILPFGNPGDDSWKLDYRAQQGYARYLGTRDLFGRVDIQTDNIEEFKEVSSRDGGLIESETTLQLLRLFEVTHRRLERYVCGVLWGEGFLKRQYFKDKIDVEKNRELLSKDKDFDSANFLIKSNLGSKIDFVQLVKTLINDKDIEVLYYNKDLANIFSEPTLFDDANLQVITDLERIALKTKDSELMSSIEDARQKIEDLQKQKEDAEQRAEDAKIQAMKAEEARSKAVYEANIAKEKQEKVEKKLEKKLEQLKIVTSLSSQDLESVTNLHHQTNVIATNIQDLLTQFVRKNKDEKIITYEEINSLIEKISFENSKIITLSRFGIKKIYDDFSSKNKFNIIDYLRNYIDKISCGFTSQAILLISFKTNIIVYETEFAPIDISILVDNMVSNARKAKASELLISAVIENEKLKIRFTSNKEFDSDVQELDELFEKGFSTTRSTGVGLYHIKSIVEENGWKIEAIREKDKAVFELTI